MDSKVEYLKDQLTQLNCDWSVFNNSKHANASTFLEKHYYSAETPASVDVKTKSLRSQNQISSDIMIYLALKETINKLNFEAGFKQLIKSHYQDDASNYTDQIKQFNYFRESTIRLSYEPDIDSIKRLFEYYNSLLLIEKRFFNLQSQCNYIYFTWYDCINGIQSTQKSIQYEKASILFNCAALYTQIAAVRQNGKESLLDEQSSLWQSAAGCLKYLNVNFSNSPSMDMCNHLLDIFIEVFQCQAYECSAKCFLKESKLKQFYNFICISKIYAHIDDKYAKVVNRINASETIKKYLPEIWFYLVKVKSLHFKSLAHYFAAMAINANDIKETNYTDMQLKELFDSLHDRSKLKTKSSVIPYGPTDPVYDYSVLKLNFPVKLSLMKAHLRESIVFQEEAVRQHSFCRKFSRNDYLHDLLRCYHDIALEKFLELENEYLDFDNELFEVLSINPNLDDKLTLNTIEPNFDDYESKDFFNLIGPIKVYSSLNEISIPYTCMLKKAANQQTYGITVKGDSPVKVNSVDPKSFAFNAGVREGDYIIAIQDQDVRWSKHAQVVERIRSCTEYVKLTLINVKRIEYPNPAQTSSLSHNNSNNNKPQPVSNNKSKSNRSSYKLKKDEEEKSPTKQNYFKSLRIPFNTLQFGRKFKRNTLNKLNFFSPMKTSNKTSPAPTTTADNDDDEEPIMKVRPTQSSGDANQDNKERLLLRKNEIMYKTI